MMKHRPFVTFGQHGWQCVVDYIRSLETEVNKVRDAVGAPRIESIFDFVPTPESRYYVEGQSGNRTYALCDSVFDNCVELDCVLRLGPQETRIVRFVTGDGPKELEVTRLE